MTLSIDRIRKAREAGYDDDKIVTSIEQRDPEFGARIKKARESGYDSSKILQSIENRLSSRPEIPENSQNVKRLDNQESAQPEQAQQPQVQQPSSPTNPTTPAEKLIQVSEGESKGLTHAFKSGLKSSASGEIAKQVFNDKTEEEIAHDPGFWEQLVHQGGEIAGDAPYFLAGSTLGAALGGSLGSVGGPAGTAVGGITGGAFGAMALPAFIKESLKEYRDYVEKGNDLTFGEFLQRADKVANKTLNQGLFGTILGSINHAMPLLTKIPGIGKFFESKIAQKTASIAAESTAAATIPAVAEGRLPEKQDFAQAVALVLGMNALQIPGAIRDKIQKKGASSKMTPEEFVKSPEGQRILEEMTKPEVKKEQRIDTAFGEMGSAISDNFYRDVFNAIKEGKTSISGTKDPFIEAAKVNYDKGLIKSKEDLKKFSDSYFSRRKEVKSGTKEPVKEPAKESEVQKPETIPEKVQNERQAAKAEQKLEKEQVKEFESEIETKETEKLQKKIDSIEKQIMMQKSKGKKSKLKVLQKNLEIQRKNLRDAKAARKYSVPQNSQEVNTSQPTLVAQNPEKITNVNVVKAISEKPVETLSKGMYPEPGFKAVTKVIKGIKKTFRKSLKWVFKKAGQDILKADTESALYKGGWRAVKSFVGTKKGLKERFFTRWQDSIGKNKKISKQDREDMIFYRERTGNPFIKGDTFEALSKRMSPESKHVVDTVVDSHMKESLNLMNQLPFMQGKGVNPRKAVEDIYIRHFYSGKISRQKVDAIFDSMNKRFGTDNPFKNTRTYLTFDQALREAGLVPKYRDIVQNLAAQDGMLTRVISNNELINNINQLEEASGQRLIVRKQNKKEYQRAKEDGWIEFQDPYLRSYVAGVSKSGKKRWAVSDGPAYVHPDLAASLQGVFSKDAYKPDNAALRLYDGVNSTLSKLHLAYSLFHFNALSESFNPAGGFVTSLLMTPKWWKQGSKLLENSPLIEDAVRHGLVINRPTDLDLQQADTFYHKLMTKMQISDSLPIKMIGKVGETANAMSRIHKFLFGEFQPRMKIITYENYVNHMLRYYEKKGVRPNEEALREIKEKAASTTNDQFGGQNFELIPFINDKKQGISRIIAYPDWLVSAVREAFLAVGSDSPIRRKLGQKYIVEYFLGLTIGTQLLSYVFSGVTNKPDGSLTWDINKVHSTLENEDPKRRNLFDIESPQFYINIFGDKINMGRDENGRKYFFHGGKKFREIYNYFHAPISSLFSKSTPLIQNATKFALDYTPSEEGLFPVRGAYVEGEFRPWDGTKKGTIDRAISYGKEIATSTFPYSLQTAVTDLFDSKEDFLKAIARTGFKFVASGFGALATGKGLSLRSSEPYWEKAFEIKDPKEREESKKALRALLKGYGYKPQQIKNIESKIDRRVNGKREKR